MKGSHNRFAGKVLINKRETCERDLERHLAHRTRLLEQLKEVDALIAGTRAYIRELDVRSGNAPDDRRLRGSLSIREMTLQVLREAERPMQVSEIRSAIKAKFDQEIERTSISPILSKMASRGELHHEDDVGWSIA